MTLHKLDTFLTPELSTAEEEYSIPLDISDIINICREYNKLGWQIQSQVDLILELGVEESLKTGLVKRESLPFIKNFLKAITQNSYFGDATSQAEDCFELICQHQNETKLIEVSASN
ncbi:hypothetical protein [Flavobacterium sp.]|uniref:hypothetical protein n=1 Tax=Flavobacterium sp. TaxID=239 RepID=UPI0032664314